MDVKQEPFRESVPCELCYCGMISGHMRKVKLEDRVVYLCHSCVTQVEYEDDVDVRDGKIVESFYER